MRSFDLKPLRKPLWAILLAICAMAWASGASAAPTVGQPAPDFTLSSTTGATISLSSFRGKHVVLEWNNPGCPYVRKHYDSGNMQALQKETTARNVIWLTINSTSVDHPDHLKPADYSQWMTRHKAAPSAALIDEDGKAGRAFGARTTPHMYMVDPKGSLIYAGGIDDIPNARAADASKATNHVRVAVSEALAGKPLSKPVTAPYGCSVKYKSAV